MTAPKLLGAVSSLLGSILIASNSAFAYHGDANHVVAPWGAILPIVVVVVVGVILLSIWKPQSRKARKRDRGPGQRAAHKKQKRAR
jgi:uncharacterized BrkB/YihY/UPF0761 family membrane protein